MKPIVPWLPLVLALAPAPVAAQISSGEFLYVSQAQRNNLPYAEVMRRTVVGGTATRIIGGCLVTAQYCGYADPVVSPDARRIAFIHEPTQEVACRSVWVASITGADARQVSTGCNHKRPAWSPDGRKLAYEGGGAIYEIGLCSATFPVRSPTRIGAGTSPSYSRDGRYLVFERSGDIWRRDTRTGTEVNLTRSSRREWDPRWTKPGATSDLIVYLVEVSSGTEVYTMTGEGKNRKRVMTSATDKWAPDVAILPTAFLWAENDQVMFTTTSTDPRSLGAGKSPSFGGATRSVTICP
jgi:Tol biopolymer transport system component